MITKKSFTLVELMIVIAVLAILSAVIVFVLNPAKLFDSAKDTHRMTDIVTIHKAIVFMETWNSAGINYGDPTKVYISIPDPLGDIDCANVAGLPTLSAGYTYACKPEVDYRKTDGNGWIPIDFSVNASSKYFSTLPVDPDNTSQYFYAYFPGGSYVLMSMLKNNVPEDSLSERKVDNFFLIGSTNRNYNLPLVALRSGPEPLVYDGYTYTTLELPSGIVWMKDSMRSTIITSGTSCCYGNSSANCDTYGRLYSRGGATTVCPSGWELPTDADWNELEGYFGMSEAEQIRGVGTWRGSTGIRDTFMEGFNVQYAGNTFSTCTSYVSNYNLGQGAIFWTASVNGSNTSYNINRRIRTGESYNKIGKDATLSTDRAYVRCILRPS